MENNTQITPQQALEVVFKLTGQLQINRETHALLDNSIRVLAQLIPAGKEGEPQNDKN